MKYLIWDVDGTLYHTIPELNRKFDDLNKRVLSEIFPDLSESERWLRFTQEKKEIKSSTLTLMKLGYPSFEKLGSILEQETNRLPYISQDPRLVRMFNELLEGFPIKHLAVRNGTTEYTKAIITALGLAEIKTEGCELGPFVKVYGVFDQFKTAKPRPEPFVFILDSLKVDPTDIVWIGDRPEVDLLPAKKLGMKTILVWADRIPERFKREIDLCLPNLYDLPLVLKTSPKI